MQLTMTTEQQQTVNLLVLTSDSPSAFVRSALIKKKEAVLGAIELYEYYQEWCRKHNLVPFSSKEFSQIAKQEIEVGFGLRYRHDLVAGGGCMRGWRGLEVREVENASNKSEIDLAA